MPDAAKPKLARLSLTRLRYELFPPFGSNNSPTFRWSHMVLRDGAHPQRAKYALRLTLGGELGHPYIVEIEFKAEFHLSAPLPADAGPMAFSEFFPELLPHFQKLVELVLGEAGFPCGQLPGFSPDGAPGRNAMGDAWPH